MALVAVALPLVAGRLYEEAGRTTFAPVSYKADFADVRAFDGKFAVFGR